MIELEMNQLQANASFRVNQDCTEYLDVGFDQEAQQGRIDPLKHPRLWIATLTPALDTVTPRMRVKRLEKWSQQDEDMAMSTLFKNLVPKRVAIHGDRLAMAQTMVNFFPKLAWLASFLGRPTNGKERTIESRPIGKL